MIIFGIIIGIFICALLVITFIIGWSMGESNAFDRVTEALMMSDSDKYQLSKK